MRPPVNVNLISKIFDFKIRQQTKSDLIQIKPILQFQIFIKLIILKIMQKEKEEKEAYATDDPTYASAKKQVNMAKEVIKKFRSLV